MSTSGPIMTSRKLISMEHTSLLLVDQLTLNVNHQALIEQFYLQLASGEFIALHGPSGSGKSTLLRAIAGLIEATRGQILLNGQSPETIGWPRFRRQVIYVQQKPTLGEMTVAENLARPFQYATAEQGAYDANHATELLERLYLSSSILNQPASTLSVGEQQRVCLVRALLLEPTVLLLDEPTSALDVNAASAALEILAEARDQRGLSAIVATHDHSRLADLCERTLKLDA